MFPCVPRRDPIDRLRTRNRQRLFRQGPWARPSAPRGLAPPCLLHGHAMAFRATLSVVLGCNFASASRLLAAAEAGQEQVVAQVKA